MQDMGTPVRRHRDCSGGMQLGENSPIPHARLSCSVLCLALQGAPVWKGCSWAILTYTQGEDASRDASPHNPWPAIGPGSELPQCENAACNGKNLFKVPVKYRPTLSFPMTVGSAQGGDRHVR